MCQNCNFYIYELNGDNDELYYSLLTNMAKTVIKKQLPLK